MTVILNIINPTPYIDYIIEFYDIQQFLSHSFSIKIILHIYQLIFPNSRILFCINAKEHLKVNLLSMSQNKCILPVKFKSDRSHGGFHLHKRRLPIFSRNSAHFRAKTRTEKISQIFPHSNALPKMRCADWLRALDDLPT